MIENNNDFDLYDYYNGLSDEQLFRELFICSPELDKIKYKNIKAQLDIRKYRESLKNTISNNNLIKENNRINKRIMILTFVIGISALFQMFFNFLKLLDESNCIKNVLSFFYLFNKIVNIFYFFIKNIFL